jgi:pimeloyl-ACP methyl ester carboxylesterase
MTTAGADSRTVRAGDATFSYWEAGSGPPLVLLHGIGSAAASFRYQLEALSARFRVAAWDAPGYGASTALAIPMRAIMRRRSMRGSARSASIAAISSGSRSGR